MGPGARFYTFLPPESFPHLGPQFTVSGMGVNGMTSEGPFCTNQQHGLMWDLEMGLVSFVITHRVMPYGGVGICSKLPLGKAFIP